MEFTDITDAYAFIDNNFNQTDLVDFLLEKEVIDYAKIEGYIDDEDKRDIFQWFVFTKFSDDEFEKLIQAKIPVLRTDYQNWVGITTYGLDLEYQVYPEIIKALYGIEATPEELLQARKTISNGLSNN